MELCLEKVKRLNVMVDKMQNGAKFKESLLESSNVRRSESKLRQAEQRERVLRAKAEADAKADEDLKNFVKQHVNSLNQSRMRADNNKSIIIQHSKNRMKHVFEIKQKHEATVDAILTHKRTQKEQLQDKLIQSEQKRFKVLNEKNQKVSKQIKEIEDKIDMSSKFVEETIKKHNEKTLDYVDNEWRKAEYIKNQNITKLKESCTMRRSGFEEKREKVVRIQSQLEEGMTQLQLRVYNMIEQ